MILRNVSCPPRNSMQHVIILANVLVLLSPLECQHEELLELQRRVSG